MRVLFRLWVVWAVVWLAIILFGWNAPVDNAAFLTMLFIVLGPLAAVMALAWVFKPRAVRHRWAPSAEPVFPPDEE